MPKKSQKVLLCRPVTGKTSFCKVESIIGIDERGQMVLPKEVGRKRIFVREINLRSSAGTKAGG